MEVGVALGIADFLHPALNAHHALQLDPMELQGGKRVARELLAFAALVVGEPHDAARVVAFDQHHPCAGAQVPAHGGQGHGIGFGQLGLNGFVEP